MEIDYPKLMSNKSEEELMTYSKNSEMYSEEAVVAAMKELKKRGIQFSYQQVEDFQLKVRERKKKANGVRKNKLNFWTKYIVTDPDAPELYSHKAIFAFSIIFTVIFGAVLLSSNLKEKRNARWIVLSFGIFYTGLAILILSFIPRNTGLTLAINAMGGWVLTQFFWNKFIGIETKYRTKPIWKPLIIASIITIPFLIAIILIGIEIGHGN
jgi:hypothetical protein